MVVFGALLMADDDLPFPRGVVPDRCARHALWPALRRPA